MFTDDTAAGNFKSDFLPCGRSLPLEGFLTDEVSLVHLDEDGKKGFLRCDGVVHLMSVKRHSGFKSQSVSGAQSAGNEAAVLAGFHESFPDNGSFILRHIDLNAFFSGVACGGYHDVSPAHGNIIFCGIVFLRDILDVYELGKDLHGSGALKGYLSDCVRDIFDGNISESVSLDPVEVLILVGCVYYQKELILIFSVGDKVVNNAAVIVAHRGVSCLTVCHT